MYRQDDPQVNIDQILEKFKNEKIGSIFRPRFSFK